MPRGKKAQLSLTPELQQPQMKVTQQSGLRSIPIQLVEQQQQMFIPLTKQATKPKLSQVQQLRTQQQMGIASMLMPTLKADTKVRTEQGIRTRTTVRTDSTLKITHIPITRTPVRTIPVLDTPIKVPTYRTLYLSFSFLLLDNE